MPSFYYSLSAKCNDDGDSEIKLRIYIAGEQVYRIGADVWINRRWWTKSNKISLPISDQEERVEILAKREILKELVKSLSQAINDHKDTKKINKSWLEGFINCVHFKLQKKQIEIKIDEKLLTHNIPLLPLFENYIQTQSMCPTDVGHCNTLLRSFKRYQLYKKAIGKNSFALYLNTLTCGDLSDIKDFLGNEKKICKKYPRIYRQVPYYARASAAQISKNTKPVNINPKERGKNFISTLMSMFKRFVAWANEKHNITSNPFDNFEIGPLVYGTPIYLTGEERPTISIRSIFCSGNRNTKRYLHFPMFGRLPGRRLDFAH